MKTRIIFALTIAVAVNAFAQQSLHRFGTVRYADGDPAAGVHITFYPGSYYSDDDYNYHEAISDKNGHYDIVPPMKVSGFYWGPVYTTNCIMARDFEKNLAAVQAFSVTTTNVNVDMTLQPAIILSGSVKDTESSPVSGAALEIRFDSGGSLPSLSPQPTKANELGQFFITALPQGVEYLIWGVTAKGYGSAYARVEAKDTQTNRYEFPTLVLKRADRIIAGRVLDSDDKPVAGAEVRFNGIGQQEWRTTKSDSGGKFVFDEVCEGEVQLYANAYIGGPPGIGIYMTSNNGAEVKVQAGNTNLAINICPNGADVGRTPLHNAAHNGDINAVKLLLASKANVNASDNRGMTPLHEAARGGYKEIVELLLTNNADVNARDKAGVTPLHEAAIGGNKDVAELLLAHGADVNVKADNGFTPLHWAALYGHKDVAELLLAHGANVNAMNNNGATPLEQV